MTDTLDESYATGRSDLLATLTKSTPEGVFRANIRRNFYDYQSYTIVERFDGTRWHKVHSAPISELAASNYVLSLSEPDGWQQAFYGDMENLIYTARSFTRAATA